MSSAPGTPSAETVLLRVEEGVATLTLNRPDRLNAFSGDMRDRLHDALDRAATNPEVRVIVITGAGRGFCTGADVEVMSDLLQRGDDATFGTLVEAGMRVIRRLQSIQQPVIAAVNGPAAGAGFGLALAADIRLVAAGATMTAGYVRIGLSPDAGVSYHLPRVIGLGPAADLLLSGRDVAADEAQRLGLASAVLPAEGFATAVAGYAERLAAGPPVALALTKRLLRQSLDTALHAQLRDELTHVKTCFATGDAREAMQAFVEKRRPTFRGE